MKTRLPVFLMLLFAGRFVFAGGDAPPKQPIADESAAIQRAIQLTGLNLFSKKISASERVSAQEDNPFAWPQLSERRVWSVKFGPTLLKLKGERSDVHDKYAKIFEVVLDKKTGWLVCVRSSAGDGKTADAPVKKVAWDALSPEERSMREMAEHINGLAGFDPKLSFLEALQRTGGYAYGTARIDAYCVNFTSNQSLTPLTCVWYFTFRNIILPTEFGVPQVPQLPPGVIATGSFTPVTSTPRTYVSARGDQHYTIDAMTGGVLNSYDTEVMPVPEDPATK